MQIEQQLNGSFLILRLNGRLDGASSGSLQQCIDQAIAEQKVRQIVLDMQQVHYLSSAGIRVLVSAIKSLRPLGGDLILAGIQGYAGEVLKLAGFDKLLTQFGSIEEAERKLFPPNHALAWEKAASFTDEQGSFRALTLSNTPAQILVLGHIEDVLYSRVTPELIHSRPFSSIEYSIGCGGLGASIEDYLPVMGEMITIGGTMVWLPTDGEDTPDFLIPQNNSETVTVRTNFNVALDGPCHEVLLFESRSPQGVTISELYRSLFNHVRATDPGFRGGLALTLRAEMPEVYGSGITRSPILENAPANGEMVIHPDNVKEWFELDHEPRHRNVTALITGVGIDLTARYTEYDSDIFNAAFYVNPANKGASDQLLHNHAVFFSPLPFPQTPGPIDDEVLNVVREGTFVDMRHLLDSSTVNKALIGISRISEFVRDTSGICGHH